MKKLRTNFLITILFLQVIFLSTHIFAEQGGARKNPVADNATSLSGKRPERKSSVVNTSADTWKIETVDAPEWVDVSSRSIAVDVNNHPHIVYGTHQLYYAYNDGNTWNYQTVDLSPEVGSNASIALDKSGKVHISYYDWTNNALKYATNASGSWVMETVDSGGPSSIAVDTADKVHISYEGANGGIMYATNASGSWVKETVDSLGSSHSIAVDTSGKVHISYFSGSIKYATNSSGSWVSTTVDSVDSGGQFGGGTSLAVDTSDKVHICYYVEYDVDSSGEIPIYSGVLKYVTNASNNIWGTTTIGNYHSGSWTGFSASIAVDSIGKVHISYYECTPDWHTGRCDGKSLEYLEIPSDFKWSIDYDEYVPDTLDTRPTSIALDTLGNAHIIYGNTGDLKYATNAPSETTPPTVVSTNPTNDATDITVNSAISATFSESMDASTINDSTFTINNGVTGTIGYDDATKTATFTPSSNLSYSTTYTATITTGVKDLAGNSMSADYVWSFTTASEPDTTPPSVISTNPLHNAINVAVNTVITATFSEPIDETTINASSFTIDGITGTVNYNPATKMATFTPSTNLDNATSYTATITTDVADNAGNHIPENYSWSFTTIPDSYHWITNPANGHLYKLIDGRDWHSCENEANTEGAHLVTINNEDEQSWLLAIFGAKARYWIGYTDEAEEGNWKWISGESSGYTNWNAGEPNNSGNCEDYGIMKPDGRWNDVGPCSPIWTNITTAVIEKVTCEPEKMLISDVRLKLKKKQSGEVTVMITDNEGCQVEGIEVKAKVGSISKQFISVLPKSGITDDKGQAIFTITTKNKTGNAKVTFRAGKLKKTLIVRVLR